MAFTDFTPEKQAKFLSALRKLPNVSGACRAAKVSRRTAYNHKDSDPEFKALWEDALDEGVDSIEESAMKRAKSGKSDLLTIFLLKAHRPDKYRDRLDVGGGLNLDIQVKWDDREDAS